MTNREGMTGNPAVKQILLHKPEGPYEMIPIVMQGLLETGQMIY